MDPKIHSLPRALSKLGFCSRTQAEKMIRAGRVSVDRSIIRDPAFRVHMEKSQINVDGTPVATGEKIYLMLNKPRGLVTTASDERGRKTVLDCLAGSGLQRVFPVGRLDKDSEGLLLLTNDTRWAAGITDPDSHVDKTYHVQINRRIEEGGFDLLLKGVPDGRDFLKARSVKELRSGGKTSWLEIILDEGRNRQIRRMMEHLNLKVIRLVRTAIGGLELGDLPKGKWRALTDRETHIVKTHGKRKIDGMS
jgi:23S rRNA pseudouridine2605 synthase